VIDYQHCTEGVIFIGHISMGCFVSLVSLIQWLESAFTKAKDNTIQTFFSD